MIEHVNCFNARKLHDLLLGTLDIVISCLVVAPCVVTYYRGTWELLGIWIFPNELHISALVSLLIGGVGSLAFTLSQHFFERHFHPDKHWLTYYMVSRCYTAVFAIVSVNMWRGVWFLVDWLNSDQSLLIIIILVLVVLLLLIATKTVRSLQNAPYLVALDHESNYFQVDTRFKIPGFRKPWPFFFDALFSFVIGTIAIAAWRGLWEILDLTLCPGDRTKSAWYSLVIGYATVLLTFIVKPVLTCICRNLENDLPKLVICDIFYFVMYFAAVNVWRGIWFLLDIYLYPDEKVFSYAVCHVVPMLVLITLRCFNSALFRGVFIDAESDKNGDCVSMPINCISLCFELERSKKLPIEDKQLGVEVVFNGVAVLKGSENFASEE